MTGGGSRTKQGPRISVVVITWRRPTYVRSCLESLGSLKLSADEVVVVDASSDDRTAQVVAEFPWATHVSFPAGAGHMTSARNEALLHVSGDVVAFVDDDANVHCQWSLGLRDAFDDPAVGAVAGRTLNGHAGEASAGVEAIGRMLANGELTGNFAADPGSMIEADHGIGANMSFRRDVLAQLGGFRNDFRGVGGVREDTDIFLRVGALGRRVVFAPAAVVDHVGAPHVKGRRFDYRYSFWMRHNHALLLARNYGIGSAAFRRWLATDVRKTAAAAHPNRIKRLAHAGIGFGGLLAGAVAAGSKGRWSPSDPVRRDPVGTAITRHLKGMRNDYPECDARGVSRIRSIVRQIGVGLLEISSAVRPAPAPRTGVLILGMHRSGTSALTAVVNTLGVTVGDEDDLLPPDEANAKGYWESATLTDFQELLLRQLGGSWDSPPSLNEGWQRSPRLLRQVGRGRRIFRRVYGESGVWVWKDPRTSLTLPFWRLALQPRILAVIIHRNPLEVARSLAARDGLSKKRALTLWERYNRELLANAQGLPAFVVAYETLVRDPVEVARCLRTFLEAHGVEVTIVPDHSIASLVDGTLRHASFGDADLVSDPDVTSAQRDLVGYLHSIEGSHEQLGS